MLHLGAGVAPGSLSWPCFWPVGNPGWYLSLTFRMIQKIVSHILCNYYVNEIPIEKSCTGWGKKKSFLNNIFSFMFFFFFHWSKFWVQHINWKQHNFRGCRNSFTPPREVKMHKKCTLEDILRSKNTLKGHSATPRGPWASRLLGVWFHEKDQVFFFANPLSKNKKTKKKTYKCEK